MPRCADVSKRDYESSGQTELKVHSDSLRPVQFVWLLMADCPPVVRRAKPHSASQHELESISGLTDWRAAWDRLASMG